MLLFHVSQLKQVLGKDYEVTHLPEVLNVEDELVIAPENRVDSRYDALGNLEVLIQGFGLLTHETFWIKMS